jgi:hypothetical protein
MHAHNDLWRMLIAQHALHIQNHEYQAQTFKKNSFIFFFLSHLSGLDREKNSATNISLLGPFKTPRKLSIKRYSIFKEKLSFFVQDGGNAWQERKAVSAAAWCTVAGPVLNWCIVYSPQCTVLSRLTSQRFKL